MASGSPETISSEFSAPSSKTSPWLAFEPALESQLDNSTTNETNSLESSEDFLSNFLSKILNESVRPSSPSSLGASDVTLETHTWKSEMTTPPSFPVSSGGLSTMTPTQPSISTMATNIVHTVFAQEGNRSMRPHNPSKSYPEVVIYEPIASSEGPDTESFNVSSFFVNKPNLSHTTTTAILSEDESEFGSPFSSLCYSTPEDYELITSMLCSSLLVLGVVYFTYGYRCFRALAFSAGLVLGTALVFAVCTAEHMVPLPYGNLAMALVVGLFLGLLTMLVTYIGLFVIGLHLGLLSSSALLIVIYLLRPFFEVLQPPLSALTLLIFFVAASLVGALSTVYFAKGCTIIASCLYGSALTLLCADYFVENFKIVHWFLDNLSNGDDWYGLLVNTKRGLSLCMGSQIVLALWPILTLFGIIVQGCFTAKGVEYRSGYGMVATTPVSTVRSIDVSSRRQTTAGQNPKDVEEARLEQKHRKYRYLYQVRTAHGDVISQHYLQSLQNSKKLCLPDTDSFTFNSDLSSHFLPSESRTTTLSVA